jgi:hypothetical protein
MGGSNFVAQTCLHACQATMSSPMQARVVELVNHVPRGRSRRSRTPDLQWSNQHVGFTTVSQKLPVITVCVLEVMACMMHGGGSSRGSIGLWWWHHPLPCHSLNLHNVGENRQQQQQQAAAEADILQL